MRATINRRRTVITGALGTGIFSLTFLAAWWNQYLAPTAGGEAVVFAFGASQFLPYRDFFSQAPPGVPMLLQAIALVAPSRLVSAWAIGVLLRTTAVLCAYGLLVRVARPWIAAVAVCVTLCVSSTDISDTPFYYNHLGASLIVIGVFVATWAAGRNGWMGLIPAFGAGALIAMAAAIKQTMVFGVAGAAVALVLLAWPRPRMGWPRWLGAVVLGGLACFLGVWLWLEANGLTEAFLFVMRRAPEGKGGVLRSLVRPLVLMPEIPSVLLASVWAWFCVLLLRLFFNPSGKAPRNYDLVVCLLIAGIGTAALGVVSTRMITLSLTALGWWGSLAMASGLLITRSGRAPENLPLIGLGLLSFAIGLCFAVSWPLFENIAFPCLALVIAVLLEHPSVSRRPESIAVGLALCAGIVGVSGYRKACCPHSWGAWIEPPIYHTRAQVDVPPLTGFRLSQEAADLYRLTRRIALESTGPDDRIFVYPNMPILYAVADRRPVTYALAHVVDTSPDFLGVEDAARLRQNPPKLMIVREDPIQFVRQEEVLYRGGEPSSVREILHAISDLEPRYKRVATFQNTVTNRIVFLVRKDVLPSEH